LIAALPPIAVGGAASPVPVACAVLAVGWAFALQQIREEGASAESHLRIRLIAIFAISTLTPLVAIFGTGLISKAAVNYAVASLLVVVALLVGLEFRRADEKGWASQLVSRVMQTPRRRSIGLVLTGLASLGLVLWLVRAGRLAEDSGVPVAGRYKVRWTCTDGVCSVNECTSPNACGKKAVGRLKEGESVEITCQAHGGPVGPRKRSSRIWDKLVDGNYVTDFYIDTPRFDRFTPGIPRCAEGGAP
jgi:hypothetical protein